jgi:predicted O-methyltransferase YrrM
MEDAVKFNTQWFDITKPVWQSLFDQVKPTRYLEIGSFEGASACFAIEHIGARGDGEVNCIDPYDEDYPDTLTKFDHDMHEVHQLFLANVHEALDATNGGEVNFWLFREESFKTLIELQEDGPDQYDCIYIDGDHHAKAVLQDCILSFPLLRKGGLLILDDYTWAPHVGASPLDSPKYGIDVFTTLYRDQLNDVAGAPIQQRYFTKR